MFELSRWLGISDHVIFGYQIDFKCTLILFSFIDMTRNHEYEISLQIKGDSLSKLIILFLTNRTKYHKENRVESIVSYVILLNCFEGKVCDIQQGVNHKEYVEFFKIDFYWVFISMIIFQK